MATSEARKAQMREYTREQWRSNPAYRQRRRKRRAILRERVAEAKVGGCVYCSEDDPVALDFHHRDPLEKSFTIAFAVSHEFSLQILERELAKCDVVCANCHRKVHAGRELERIALS